MENCIHKEDDDLSENELVETGMQIILHAGNARVLADMAFKLAKENKIKDAYEKMKEAEQEILKAHQTQTTVIQSEAAGIVHQPSLLFNHAQDTLMTIMSEIRIEKKMIELCELIIENKKEDIKNGK